MAVEILKNKTVCVDGAGRDVRGLKKGDVVTDLPPAMEAKLIDAGVAKASKATKASTAEGGKAISDMTVKELKEHLDGLEIEYDPKAKKDDLVELALDADDNE